MIAEIRRQFDLAWALAELHLAALGEEDFHWEPADPCWAIRRDERGQWRPDFAEVEPDPVPVPTIAWLTWHIDYWWSAAISTLNGREPRAPADVTWPGSGPAAVSALRALATQWRKLLEDMTPEHFAEPSAFPWGAGDARTVGDTVLWVTVELTKNVSEIGQLRLLHAARSGA